MKKSLIALAVLAASGAAMAQSSVTLYGKVDAWGGVTKIDKGDGNGSLSNTVIQDGGAGSSRWGMKGSEDLGGGLKANFTLESGYNSDNGTQAQGRLFGRQAWVGLSGGFGDVQIGRVRSVSHIIPGAFQGVLDSKSLAPLNLIGRVNDNGNAYDKDSNSTLRFNNAISYTTPNMGGFNARVQYALGENNTKGADADAAYAINVNYAGGPLAVSAFYQVDSCEQGAVPGAVPPVLAKASGNASVACTGGTEDREFWFLGAKYNFGMAVLKGSYGHAENIFGLNNAKSSEYQIGVDVPLSPALVLTASYARADDNGVQSFAKEPTATSKIDREGYAAGAKYSLSKRTFVYAGISYVEETARNILDKDQTSYALGVQHNF